MTSCLASWRTGARPSASAPPLARTHWTSTGSTCTPRTEEASWSAQTKRPGRTLLLSLGLALPQVGLIPSKSIMAKICYPLNVTLSGVVWILPQFWPRSRHSLRRKERMLKIPQHEHRHRGLRILMTPSEATPRMVIPATAVPLATTTTLPGTLDRAHLTTQAWGALDRATLHPTHPHRGPLARRGRIAGAHPEVLAAILEIVILGGQPEVLQLVGEDNTSRIVGALLAVAPHLPAVKCTTEGAGVEGPPGAQDRAIHPDLQGTLHQGDPPPAQREQPVLAPQPLGGRGATPLHPRHSEALTSTPRGGQEPREASCPAPTPSSCGPTLQPPLAPFRTPCRPHSRSREYPTHMASPEDQVLGPCHPQAPEGACSPGLHPNPVPGVRPTPPWPPVDPLEALLVDLPAILDPILVQLDLDLCIQDLQVGGQGGDQQATLLQATDPLPLGDHGQAHRGLPGLVTEGGPMAPSLVDLGQALGVLGGPEDLQGNQGLRIDRT